MAYEYPLPGPDAETAGFWEAAKNHELRIQRCVACGHYQHPPQKVCKQCQGEESEWALVSGAGKIYRWCEFYQAILPAWKEDVPYNVIDVELDDAPGVTVIGNLVGSSVPPRVGAPVRVTFDDVTDEVTIPRWQPA